MAIIKTAPGGTAKSTGSGVNKSSSTSKPKTTSGAGKGSGSGSYTTTPAAPVSGYSSGTTKTSGTSGGGTLIPDRSGLTQVTSLPVPPGKTGGSSAGSSGGSGAYDSGLGRPDYSTLIQQGIRNGASWQEIQNLQNTRNALIAGDASLAQYAGDLTDQLATNYISRAKSDERSAAAEASYQQMLEELDSLAQRQSANDYSAYIEQMNQAQQEAALAELRAAYEANLAGLDRTRQDIAPQYESARNQAAGNAALQQQAFHEYAAARGLNSGAGGQAQLAMSNALQTNLSALDAAEASGMADLDLQRSQAEIDYNNAIAQAQTEGNYQLAQQLYQEKVRVDEALREQIASQAQLAMQTYQLGYNAYRDQVSDQRYDQQWNYQAGRDQASDEKEDYEKELNIAVYLAGAGQFGRLANLWGMNEAEAQALVDSYAAQKQLTQAQAAQELAAAQGAIGELSGYAALGWDTSYLKAMQDYELRGAALGLNGQKSTGSYRSSDSGGAMSLSTAKQYAENGIFNDDVLDVFHKNGYSDELLAAQYGYTPAGTVPAAGSGAASTQAGSSPLYFTVMTQAQNLAARGGKGETIAAYLQHHIDSGSITRDEAEAIANLLMGG